MIDTTLYPSAQAQWQREHYWFEITDEDDFIFYEKLNTGEVKEINGKITWNTTYSSDVYFFTISTSDPHPLVDSIPTLYRGNRKFYYVFETSYGNMFWRKVK